jgi:hypothetical protein
MKASNTHFEQIPVEKVRKIAKEFANNNAIANDEVTTETPDAVAPQQKRLREMAQKVQVEKDPQKMIKLVEQLISAFDEEQRLRKTLGSGPAT